MEKDEPAGRADSASYYCASMSGLSVIVKVEHAHEEGESDTEIIPGFLLHRLGRGQAEARLSSHPVRLEDAPPGIPNTYPLLDAPLQEFRPHGDGIGLTAAAGGLQQGRGHGRGNLIQHG